MLHCRKDLPQIKSFAKFRKHQKCRLKKSKKPLAYMFFKAFIASRLTCFIRKILTNIAQNIFLSLYFLFIYFLFYVYIYPPDSQESNGGANT